MGIISLKYASYPFQGVRVPSFSLSHFGCAMHHMPNLDEEFALTFTKFFCSKDSHNLLVIWKILLFVEIINIHLGDS